MTEVDLLAALRDCYDPVSRRSIVELKLVRDVSLTRDADAPGAGIAGVPAKYIARVTLTAPGNDDAVNAQLVAVIENRLAGLEAISRTEVTLQPALFAILR